MKLAAPYVSRGTGGRRGLSASPFNEGVQVPKAEWDRIAERNPGLNSRDAAERTEAVRGEILHGELAKHRRR